MKVWKAAMLVLAASCAMAAFAVAHPLETAYPPNSQPMVTGTVTGSTDHSLSLHTDDGESMTFIIDSHSMVPEHMNTGMRESVEFKALTNGEFLAQRVVPLRAEENRNAQTTVNTTELEHDRYAMRNGTGEAMGYSRNGGTETQAQYASNERTETETDTDNDADNDHDADDLPQTASAQPLLLLLGLGSLTAGAALWVARRRTA